MLMIPFIKLAEFQALQPNMVTGQNQRHAKFSFALTSNTEFTHANQNS